MQVTSVGNGTIVLTGRLDARGAAVARDALHAALDGAPARLVVDLSGVELLDATGLGVLVAAHRRARLAGGALVLRGAPPRVARLLTLTRLDRVLEVERTALSA